jgi:type I restriction enzyme S subunit
MGQRMMLARFVKGTIDPQYVAYTIMEPDMMDRVQDKPVGATVQHLRVGGIETMLVPLPPLAEQKRIVAKVDELMALVDRLEAKLVASREVASRLMEAMVAELAGRAA